MWRILTACLLAASLVVGHHDGTDHHEGTDHHDEDHKALILLEIEPNVNSTGSKDKRSPQQESSQAIYGASPGQFIVRSSGTGEESQPDVPPEYLSLLQQLVSQQQQDPSAEAQSPSQPVIQQLLISRNPDPTAVQFTNNPRQPPRRRPPPTPQAQLQQLYFNRQFQQQIPVRPRILRPLRPIAPSSDDYSALTTTSQAHNVHEARLRASLAGSDPNIAVQALNQQQAFQTTSSPESPGSLYDQHLAQLATAAQEQLAQFQSVPQQETAQAQSIPQQETAYTINPQVRYVQEPQQIAQRAVSYSTSSRQSAPSQQLISSERVKSARRQPPPEQYLRETTQPIPQQTVVQIPQRQQASNPSVYLASQSGQQTPSESQDEEFLSQLLSQPGRGLFPGATATGQTVAEEIIKSTTALPPTASRSSIYVTQTSNVKASQNPGKITIEEVGQPQQETGTPLPIVHLPTPEGQRPLTQSEFQALIEAGFNISPAPESPQDGGIVQTVAPEYYRPTTKKQRSYVTPAPPQRNHISYQSRQKTSQEEKEDVRAVQEVAAPQVQNIQQRGQVNRFRLQETKPEEEEIILQYVRRPDIPETQSIRQEDSVTKLQFVTEKPEPEEETIHFIRIPTTPEVQNVRQRGHLTRYQPEVERNTQQAQLQRYQEERQNIQQEIQTTRYHTQESQPEEPTYQTEPISLPQQTPSYQHEDESSVQEVPRFHPIIVAELPTTTPVPSSTPRRRRPRPSHSRIVYRAHPTNDQTRNQEPPTQYLVSYDSIPEATSFGTRNTRVRGRRPTSAEES